jgi:hypothetical protein
MDPWIDLLERAEFLRKLFPDAPPPLANVRLHELVLRDASPTISLAIDLDAYPASPPPKWHPEWNTAQVRIDGAGLRALALDGGGIAGRGRLTLARSHDGVEVKFAAEGFAFSFECDALLLVSVTGYRDG